MFVASDVAALVRSTRQVVHLDDGELAVLTRRRLPHVRRSSARRRSSALHRRLGSVDCYDSAATRTSCTRRSTSSPPAIERALRGRLDERFATAHLGGIDLDAREVLRDPPASKLLGCGTAYYAGMAGAQLIEELARIPADAEPAAEFRYRNPVIERDALYVAVSQSGETADTLAAVQEIKRKGGRVIARRQRRRLDDRARVRAASTCTPGPEISVASTKAFTSMSSASRCSALHLGRVRDLGPGRGGAAASRGCAALPDAIARDPRRRGADRGRRRALRVGRRRCSSSAATAATRSRSRARRSSRRSPTSTPRRTRRASSSTGRWRWSRPTSRRVVAGAGRRPGREEHLDHPPDPGARRAP